MSACPYVYHFKHFSWCLCVSCPTTGRFHSVKNAADAKFEATSGFASLSTDVFQGHSVGHICTGNGMILNHT